MTALLAPEPLTEQEDWSMPRAEPRYSRSQVDKAGRYLVTADLESWATSLTDWGIALSVVDNWRASHSFPLNTFGVGLRVRAKRISSEALVAQRIKRFASIDAKLRRFPGLRLSQMQDIGGCRAVMSTREDTAALVESYKTSELKHHLAREDDYIASPKESGYRGVHLVYRYNSDRKTTYNGMQIEVQLRSRLQHAWATAVETVGTFLQQSLKASMGAEEWLRFFALMGSVMAFREKTAPVPDTPVALPALIADLKHYVKDLDVANTLSTYGAALNVPQTPNFKGARYYLMELVPGQRTLTIRGFQSRDLELATDAYSKVERALKDPGSQAVLVSVDSIDSLRAAYPNYFLDTGLFLSAMQEAIA